MTEEMEDFALPASGGTWELIPEVMCNAVCVEVLLARMRNTFQEDQKLQTRFIFETDQLKKDGSNHEISTRWLTVSTHEKSNMGKFLRQWLGEDFPSAEELKAGTYKPREHLPGRTARITVLHEPDRKDPAVIWARIAACKPGTEPMVPSGQHVMEEDKVESPF